MNLFTIFGSSGFIGSHLSASLEASGVDCLKPGRSDRFLGRDLGHVIYCIGLTADFRSRPFDAVEAHVCYLRRVLGDGKFSSFTYLSSTRIYGGKDNSRRETLGASEDDDLTVNPNVADDLYNLSKLMGESLVLAAGRVRHLPARAVRISNVYGGNDDSGNFLSSVLMDAVNLGRVTLQTSLCSTKDYVSIDDAVTLLPQIAADGTHPVYNLASGENVSNASLVQDLERLTGAKFCVSPDAPDVVYPRIAITRAAREFGYQPRFLPAEVVKLVANYKQRNGDSAGAER